MWGCNFPSKPDHLWPAVKGSEGTRSLRPAPAVKADTQSNRYLTGLFGALLLSLFLDLPTRSGILRKGLWPRKQTANQKSKTHHCHGGSLEWSVTSPRQTGKSSPNCLLALKIDLCLSSWAALMWFQCDWRFHWRVQGNWCKWKSKTSLLGFKKKTKNGESLC